MKIIVREVNGKKANDYFPALAMANLMEDCDIVVFNVIFNETWTVWGRASRESLELFEKKESLSREER